MLHSTKFDDTTEYIGLYCTKGSQTKKLISSVKGWWGGVIVLGILPVPGIPTNFILRQVPTAQRKCGWGGGGIFRSFFISPIFLPLFGRRPDID